MRYIGPSKVLPLYALALMVLAVGGGCQTVPVPNHAEAIESQPAFATNTPVARCNDVPRELSKVVLPTYRIEPPDILLIDALNSMPRMPYLLRTSDQLAIHVEGAFDDAPIGGIYPIGPGGLVQLGPRYAAVKVSGLTPEDAQLVVESHLGNFLRDHRVSVSLAQIGAMQLIAGEHMVGPDGTVTLGIYGSVQVVGMTLAEAKIAIETHLSRFLEAPEVSVDVFAYNSKVYYIVTQGAGLGDGLYSFPVTGGETVLDAIAQINGLDQLASKKIWIARPTREPGKVQILPVSWDSITAHAGTETNYQILPGDRVFIAEDKMVLIDTIVAKVISPFERIMGFAILGAETATRFYGPVLRGGGNPRGRGY